MPMGRLFSTTGTALMRLAISSLAMSVTDVSGLTVMTRLVMMSAAIMAGPPDLTDCLIA